MDPVQGINVTVTVTVTVTVAHMRTGEAWWDMRAPTGSLTEDAEGGVDILCNVRHSFSELIVTVFFKHRAIKPSEKGWVDIGNNDSMPSREVHRTY